MENLFMQFKGGGLAFNVAFRSAKVALPSVGFREAFGFKLTGVSLIGTSGTGLPNSN